MEIVRYLLIAAGSFATGKGWVTSDQVTSAIGAVGTLFTVAWGIYVKFGTRATTANTAARHDVPVHQRRDRRGQVNPTTTGVLMRKLVAAIAVVSGLALAGCQTASLPSLNLNTAIALNTVYGIENAYGVAVNAANAYKALPLCRTGTVPGAANICARRSVIERLQVAMRKAQGASRRQ